MREAGVHNPALRDQTGIAAAHWLRHYPFADYSKEDGMAERKGALVTGAGTGVGRAVTLALMREGYAVVLAGRRKELLDTVAKEGAQTPGEALTVAADVADPTSIKALFAKAKDNYGRLDLLFNNAGIGAPAVPIEDLPLDKWQAVVATNLTDRKS